MNGALIEARRGFGHDVLGPVFNQFMHRLERSFDFFGRAHGAKPLFTARAGVRIRYLYEAWCMGRGTVPQADAEMLWLSRFMTAKGVWNRNRDASLALIAAEFPFESTGKVVEAIFAAEDGPPASYDPEDTLMALPGQRIRQAFETPSRIMEDVEAYLSLQSDRFLRYIGATLEGRPAGLLVDSGWQGTMQRLLHESLPGIEWYGVYYGRSFLPGGDRSVAHRMWGLIFEADAFDPREPETAVIGHRHLIEALLEPRAPSIETLDERDDGTVFAPQSAAFADAAPQGDQDAIYEGVAAYLRGPAARAGAAASRAAFRRASAELARLLVFPSADEARILGGDERSADFGRSVRVPVLLPPAPRNESDAPETRVRDALWQAGQVALEYRGEMAMHRQQQLAGLKMTPAALVEAALAGRSARPRPAALGPAAPRRPKVAVIMRTMDRPAFLRRALESVARQTLQDFQLVVVCDGGDAAGAAREIEASRVDPRRVTLVDNVRNRGMEAASNIAIRASSSDHIVIHDDDDSWEPTFLERTVRFLDDPANARYGGVITHSWYVSEEVMPEGVVERSRTAYHDWVANVQLMEMSCGNFFPPIAFLFRREICERLGGFDERFPVLGDWDFNLRTLAVSEIGVIPEKLALYHHRDTGNVGLYSNSVIGMRAKHAEYAPLLRHKYLRQAADDARPEAGLGMIMPLAHVLDDIRNTTRGVLGAIRALEGRDEDRGQLAAHFSRKADERWAQLVADSREIRALREQLGALCVEHDREIAALQAMLAEGEGRQAVDRQALEAALAESRSEAAAARERAEAAEAALVAARSERAAEQALAKEALPMAAEQELAATRSALETVRSEADRLRLTAGTLRGANALLCDAASALQDDLWTLRHGLQALSHGSRHAIAAIGEGCHP